MTITWEGGQKFVIKTKQLTVKIGEKINLGELEISEPGEYEVAGVQVDQIDGVIQIYAEGINVSHIKKGKVLTDDELEKLNGVDILLIGVGAEGFTETKTALEMISQIDPAIVIPMAKGDVSEFTKEEGKNEPVDELKISKGELPQDDRQIVILNARG